MRKLVLSILALSFLVILTTSCPQGETPPTTVSLSDFLSNLPDISFATPAAVSSKSMRSGSRAIGDETPVDANLKPTTAVQMTANPNPFASFYDAAVKKTRAYAKTHEIVSGEKFSLEILDQDLGETFGGALASEFSKRTCNAMVSGTAEDMLIKIFLHFDRDLPPEYDPENYYTITTYADVRINSTGTSTVMTSHAKCIADYDLPGTKETVTINFYFDLDMGSKSGDLVYEQITAYGGYRMATKISAETDGSVLMLGKMTGYSASDILHVGWGDAYGMGSSTVSGSTYEKEYCDNNGFSFMKESYAGISYSDPTLIYKREYPLSSLVPFTSPDYSVTRIETGTSQHYVNGTEYDYTTYQYMLKHNTTPALNVDLTGDGNITTIIDEDTGSSTPVVKEVPYYFQTDANAPPALPAYFSTPFPALISKLDGKLAYYRSNALPAFVLSSYDAQMASINTSDPDFVTLAQ